MTNEKEKIYNTIIENFTNDCNKNGLSIIDVLQHLKLEMKTSTPTKLALILDYDTFKIFQDNEFGTYYALNTDTAPEYTLTQVKLVKTLNLEEFEHFTDNELVNLCTKLDCDFCGETLNDTKYLFFKGV